jgi:PncC family amidohydrolase
VTYANRAKVEMLAVSEETLAQYGAVSEETCREMAAGALATSGADLAISVTGIAGPGGGSEEKPVGTVFLGLAEKGKEVAVFQKRHPRGRKSFKEQVSQVALDLIRRRVQHGE